MLTEKKYRFSNLLNTRIGFFLLVVILFCVKTYIVYQTKFTLGVKGGLQEFILAINPIPAALLTLGIALYFSGRLSYWLMMIIDTLETIWIFANIVYYREFSDFLSLGIIKVVATSRIILARVWLKLFILVTSLFFWILLSW